MRFSLVGTIIIVLIAAYIVFKIVTQPHAPRYIEEEK